MMLLAGRGLFTLAFHIWFVWFCSVFPASKAAKTGKNTEDILLTWRPPNLSEPNSGTGLRRKPDQIRILRPGFLQQESTLLDGWMDGWMGSWGLLKDPTSGCEQML